MSCSDFVLWLTQMLKVCWCNLVMVLNCLLVLLTHCCTSQGAACRGMTLAQEDIADVDVLISVCVTQVELQRVPGVTMQTTHQGSIRAQRLETSPGLSGPAALQQNSMRMYPSRLTVNGIVKHLHFVFTHICKIKKLQVKSQTREHLSCFVV